MARSVEIILYLCSNLVQGVDDVEASSVDKSIQFTYDEDGKLTVSIPLVSEDADCLNDPGKSGINYYLAGDSIDMIECLSELGELTWVRDVKEYTYGVSIPYKYITFKFDNPDIDCLDCLWWETAIAAHHFDSPFPVNPPLLLKGRKWDSTDPGLIPASGEVDDFLPSKAQTSDSYDDVDPNVVPGCDIDLYWALRINGEIYRKLIAQVPFYTPLVTGAEIIALNGDENSPDKTYTVSGRIIGTIDVKPTDFAQYEIGSWVYLLIIENAGQTYERTVSFGSSTGIDINENSRVRMVPLDFETGPVLQGDFETLDYNLSSYGDFDKSFELSLFDGVITQMRANSADVEVTIHYGSEDKPDEILEFDNVEIFYHCEGSTNTDIGHSAFQEGDQVLVLNESVRGPISANDLVIIGFKDILKNCASGFFVVYGSREERITTQDDPEHGWLVGEGVTCSDGGSAGSLDAVENFEEGGIEKSYLYTSFVKCWAGTIHGSTSGSSGYIEECLMRYYTRLYQAMEMFSGGAGSIITHPDWLEFINPLDQNPLGNVDCTSVFSMSLEWTKTLDDLVVTAFLFKEQPTDQHFKWAVAAAYNNQILHWQTSDAPESRLSKDYFPNSGFTRTVCTTTTCDNPEDFTDTHIGFDVWKKTSVTGKEEYYIGIIDDQSAALTEWKLVGTSMVQQHFYQSTLRPDIYPEPPGIPGWADRHVRLVGYGYDISASRHRTYWCALGYDDSYYEEDITLNSYLEYNYTDSESAEGYTKIENALWNPIKRELYIQTSSLGDSLNPDDGYRYITSPDRLVATYGVTGWSYNFDGGWFIDPGYGPSFPLPPSLTTSFTSKPLTINYDSVNHEFELLCCNAVDQDDPYDIQEVNTYWTGVIGSMTLKEYFGKFTLHGISKDKGEKKTWNDYFWRARSLTSKLVPNQQCADVSFNVPNTGGAVTETGNRKDYRFNKWIFTPSFMVHSYDEIQYVEYHDCNETFWPITYLLPKVKDSWVAENCLDEYCVESGDTHCMGSPSDNDLDWQTFETGDLDILACASGTFPYDYGWTAIALEGKARSSSATYQATATIKDRVIYRDLSTFEFFIIDGSGTRKNIGLYNRAYFQRRSLF